MSEKWKTWIKAALIRAIRTVAQTMAATIGTSALMSEVDWKMVISSGILAGIISILTSLATGLPEVELLHIEEKKQTEETETDVQG